MLGPVPAVGRTGLAESPPGELAVEVLAAWDAFLDVVTAPSTDLSRPSRLPGWTGREVCLHLGHWPDAQVLDAVLESARTGDLSDTPDPDRTNAALLVRHAGATEAQVVAALVDARDRVEDFFASADAVELGRVLSRSAVAPLPVLSLVHAGTYELAVHALDLAPCGAPPPPPQLLDRGLAALIDVTGALAARAQVELALTALSPAGGWRFTSSGDGWTTERAAQLDGVGVRGTAEDLLDASAGRVNLPQLLLQRRLHVAHLPQWMRLAPLLEDVPGLPGGAALQAGVRGLSGVGRVLGRLRR